MHNWEFLGPVVKGSCTYCESMGSVPGQETKIQQQVNGRKQTNKTTQILQGVMSKVPLPFLGKEFMGYLRVEDQGGMTHGMRSGQAWVKVEGANLEQVRRRVFQKEKERGRKREAEGERARERQRSRQKWRKRKTDTYKRQAPGTELMGA